MNITALENTAGIISNKAFQRLAEKTQVVFPKNGRKETVQNRLTHSYEVSNSARVMEQSISIPGLQIDYQGSLQNTCLLHDIGHPPFGHEGSDLLNRRFKELGLEEGFSDNNNNFVVIQKNQIEICDYTQASLIKYPHKLYKSQKSDLTRILDKSVDLDIKHFEKHIKIYERPSRTIACEIMDEADRNSYVFSDLADCYSLKLADESEFERILDEKKYETHFLNEISLRVYYAIKNHDKSLIKRAFNDLKKALNKNFYIGDNLLLKPINEELISYREELFEIEKRIFIDSKEVVSQRKEHIEILNKYIDWILEGNYPSKTYAKKISQSSGDVKLAAIRDMIGETTDWFVLNTISEIKS